VRDFTLEKYVDLIQAIFEADYTTLTVREFLTGCYRSARCAILRHDVDRMPRSALRMAKLEASLSISSTYYFRYPATFDPDLITRIRDLGHEVGYHYEVLAKAKGNHEWAIALFRDELKEFRGICDVRTICMHGSPLSHHDNRDLWKEYDFKDYGIEGEAYLSMAGKGLRYLTDTGRSWSGKHTVRDVMPGAKAAPMETTDDLALWIGSTREEGLYLTVHPERWTVSEGEWIISYSKDAMVNFGKDILRIVQ